MNTAIYFHPEAYTTTGPKLMGRNAAGESFLRGVLTHSRQTEFWSQVSRPDHGRAFAQAVRAAGRPEPVHAVDKHSLARLAKPGNVYHPGPGIGEHAWQRAAYGHAAWSLCGITHTTSSARAMDAVAELLTAPVQPWDAVICTSSAVKDNVTRVLQAQTSYLAQRLGASQFALPMLPVIPLGIHTADFEFSPAQRQQARAQVQAQDTDLVVLYTGRLSFHAKAHPLAMYQALELAAQRLPKGQRVLLVECGWHANEVIAKAFLQAAQLACPSVRLLTLDGRVGSARSTAWAAADVFCSLSDNIQETFGIVPIEAMAAGLPVVVSDWDGYKDTVRDGIDGFRVPTLMPGPGLGADLALRHALEVDSYDMYCGLSSALVAVDIGAAARAFGALFASPGLRQQMGQAGRQRARTEFDWAAIIARYEDLWAQQEQLRLAQGPLLKPLPQPWPARMDPFHAFASYPTHSLSPRTVLGLRDATLLLALARLASYQQLAMVNFAKTVLPEATQVQVLLEAAAPGPRAAAQLVQALPAKQRAYGFRALAWLLKMGLLQHFPDQSQP